MSISGDTSPIGKTKTDLGDFIHWGLFWLIVALLGAAVFFAKGLGALLAAWQLPEYSHGPLIPVLSGLLFLRQLKTEPVQAGPADHRWVGVLVIVGAMVFGLLGKLASIADIVAYATILWVFGLLLVSFGWRQGRRFWPPVLHLVYMLPLPGVLYFKISTTLQFISSELGVWMLKLFSVPVFLDGNIIDLGVTKLHVAEACSGLRYMFPIMSFSYIFAVLYRGPVWHKAVLLLAAVPLAVMMNSIRIAIAGVGVAHYGTGFVEGFSHFFEGWVIFLACVLILFALARIMLLLNRKKMSLSEALDLDTTGLGTQAMRVRLVQPSSALIGSALVLVVAALAWQVQPGRGTVEIARDSFAVFPRQLADGWEQTGPRMVLEKSVVRALKADDYHQVDFIRAGDVAPVGLFMAWYADQSKDGVHSPEICLPGGGWEIAWLERTDVSALVDDGAEWNINRAIIQYGENRMMVYYWFEQKGRHIAWDFAAKFWLMADGIRTGRTDGALVRLTTPILAGEADADAEARLQSMFLSLQEPLPRFIPRD